MVVAMTNCTGSSRPKNQKEVQRVTPGEKDLLQCAYIHQGGDAPGLGAAPPGLGATPELRQALQRPSPRPLSKLPHAHLAGVAAGIPPIMAAKGLAPGAPGAPPAPGIPAPPAPPAPPIICIIACIIAGSCIMAA